MVNVTPDRMGRPNSLADVAARRIAGESFDALVREFLDQFYVASPSNRTATIVSEPLKISPVHDAYLAATAEHLALRFGLTVPGWVEAPGRFLRAPFFAGGLERLKAILLIESPLAFRRRQVFVSRNVLSRPRDRGVVDAGSCGA